MTSGANTNVRARYTSGSIGGPTGEPVHALLGRYSYRAVDIRIRNCSTRGMAFESHS